MKFTEMDLHVLKTGKRVVVNNVTYKSVNNIIIGSDGSRTIPQKPAVTNSKTVDYTTPGSIAQRVVNMALAKAKRPNSYVPPKEK